MPCPWEQIHGLNLFQRIPLFTQELSIAGGGGGVAADHDEGAWGHLDNGSQGGVIAAFARRVHHDHIGVGTLAGKAGCGFAGVHAVKIGFLRGQAKMRSNGFGTFHCLRHNLNTDQAAAVRLHRKANGAHTAVKVQQKVIRLQPGKLFRLGVQQLGSGGVDLIKLVHTHLDGHSGQSILNHAGAKHGAGIPP